MGRVRDLPRSRSRPSESAGDRSPDRRSALMVGSGSRVCGACRRSGGYISRRGAFLPAALLGMAIPASLHAQAAAPDPITLLSAPTPDDLAQRDWTALDK